MSVLLAPPHRRQYDVSETSGTNQYAYAFTEAVNRDLLDEKHSEVTEDAINAAKTVVAPDGVVQRNAAMPGGLEAPQLINLYGQGWFLTAGKQVLESDADV